jgi:sialic acid synthase SpsE
MRNANKLEIIAEIGVNHNGKVSIAKKLIDVAKKTGATAVKFQTYVTDNFVLKKAKKVKYQIDNLKKSETHYEMLKMLELKQSDFKIIKKYCKKKKIEFISTPYDLESVTTLEKINVRRYKVASADIDDYLLHKKISKTNKKVIISTGMCTTEDIKKTIKLYKKQNVTLLHCVSSYPCELHHSHISRIIKLKKIFKLPVGFSDHTTSYEPAIMAYAAGARIFEKHITLSNKMNGPDHKASLNPKEFKIYIEKLKTAEKIYGKFKNKLLPIEKNMKNTSSKSITLIKNLKSGDKIRIADIAMKRPGTGLKGFFVPKIIGKKLKKEMRANTQIRQKDLI